MSCLLSKAKQCTYVSLKLHHANLNRLLASVASAQVKQQNGKSEVVGKKSVERLGKIQEYAAFTPSPVSLGNMMQFGREVGCEKTSFSFLRKELPVRLANIMKEISLLPDNLLSMPSVDIVQKMYVKSFEEILDFERSHVDSSETREEFCKTLAGIRNRHVNVVETMAMGVMELRDSHGIDHNTGNQIQYFLDRFYMSRISIRMLINQHTLLFGENAVPINDRHQHIGSIDPHCDVLAVAKDAYANARFLCEQYYMTAPEVEYESYNPTEHGNPVRVVYVPSHLYHMLFELLKNSMRAVVEHHGADADEYPIIKVVICKGVEDMTIKVSDRGGGIPHSQIDLMFNYMYSTAPQPPPQGSSSHAPLAGYGYGLPLSRLYAKYFQGDLQLSSVEGLGTDAHIYLKVLSDEANELLPVFNKTSSKQYAQGIPIADWSNPNHTTGLHSVFHRQYTTGCKKTNKV